MDWIYCGSTRLEGMMKLRSYLRKKKMHPISTAIKGKTVFNCIKLCSYVDPDIYLYPHISVFHLYFFIMCFTGASKLAQ